MKGDTPMIDNIETTDILTALSKLRFLLKRVGCRVENHTKP
jgi:hypothetical protein